MKRLICKSLLLTVGVFGLFNSVCVNAADFKFEKPTRENNVTNIPLSIVVSEGDGVKNVKFGCETNDTDVSCKIEQKQLSNITVIEDAAGLVFNDVTEDNTGFAVGTIELANLIITNESTSQKTVTITLKSASITQNVNVDLTKSINTDVNAKVPERELSSDASLKNVTISQGKINPEFSKDIYEYVVYDILDTINSVKFAPECSDSNTCSFTLNGGKSVNGLSVTLNQGENKVTLIVESEDGKNKNTYSFTVYRGETDYNATTLTSLEVEGFELTPAFDKNTLEYTVNVSNSVESFKDLIKYKTTDASAKAVIKNANKEFVVGKNTISVVVTSADGNDTSTYKLIVNRAEAGNIEVLRYFDNKVTYKDSDGVQITLSFDEFKTKFSSEATKIANNEYAFDKDGYIVTGVTDPIVVDTVDKTPKKPNKIVLIAIISIVGLGIIIISGILIFRKKEPEIEEKRNENITPIHETEDNSVIEEIKNDYENTLNIDEALNDLMNTKQYEVNTENDVVEDNNDQYM